VDTGVARRRLRLAQGDADRSGLGDLALHDGDGEGISGVAVLRLVGGVDQGLRTLETTFRGMLTQCQFKPPICIF
jgi:hypothetical protein